MLKSSHLLIATVLLCSALSASGQAHSATPDQTQTASKPTYPYIFSNFVWWSDAELRHDLKQRIPSLTDQITSDWPMQSRIRTALMALLQQKGIHAEVQIIGVGPNAASASLHHLPDAPAPSITFTVIAPPQILIKDLVSENIPPEAAATLETVSNDLKGKPYSQGGLWYQKSQILDQFRQAGYLSATINFEPGTPVKQGENYLVPLKVRTDSGPQYHVALLTADGGPLLPNQDLSYGFTAKPGDIAKPDPFLPLERSLSETYRREGYADVDLQVEPTLDKEHALATYKLIVIPGVQYRLGSLTIKNLSSTQELAVRSLFKLRVGDVYEMAAVIELYSQLLHSDELKGESFSFSPAQDKERGLISLTLTFHNH